MGWLLGVPLRIFQLLASYFMVALRVAVPILVVAVVVFLLWRSRRERTGRAAKEQEPEFHGPVYTVEYEDVKEEEEP